MDPQAVLAKLEHLRDDAVAHATRADALRGAVAAADEELAAADEQLRALVERRKRRLLGDLQHEVERHDAEAEAPCLHAAHERATEALADATVQAAASALLIQRYGPGASCPQLARVSVERAAATAPRDGPATVLELILSNNSDHHPQLGAEAAMLDLWLAVPANADLVLRADRAAALLRAQANADRATMGQPSLADFDLLEKLKAAAAAGLLSGPPNS